MSRRSLSSAARACRAGSRPRDRPASRMPSDDLPFGSERKLEMRPVGITPRAARDEADGLGHRDQRAEAAEVVEVDPDLEEAVVIHLLERRDDVDGFCREAI